MNRAEEFVDRVGRLLADLDPDDRTSLLADLRDQLEQQDDRSLLLGTPEEFVAEYRQSAGMAREPDPMLASQVASIVLVALTVLLLFSFGGQIVLGPTVLVVGWFLARSSSVWLRYVWTVVAALMSGEIAFILLAAFDWPNRVYPLLGTLLAAVLVGLLFLRTTRTPPGPNHIPLAIISAGGVAAASLLVAGLPGDSPWPAALVGLVALLFGGVLMRSRR